MKISSIFILLSTSVFAANTILQDRQILGSVTSLIGGAFSTVTSAVVGEFSTITSAVPGEFSTVTSAAAGAFSTATSEAASEFSKATSAFESATSAAGASASAGHATIPNNVNWLGITIGLTVGVIGGLGIVMA